jgi:hypothetical protein
MALFQRTSPVGLDKSIIDFQNHLTDTLAFANWNNFDRVYLNEKNPTGLVPEYYDGNGDYQEVLYNDGVDISSFFFRSSEVKPVGDGYEVNVAWIVQCDLNALFPLISHRADEELAALILEASGDYPIDDRFSYQSTEYQINNVYREFDKKQLKHDDVSERHVVRFNYKVFYTLVGSLCN